MSIYYYILEREILDYVILIDLELIGKELGKELLFNRNMHVQYTDYVL